MVIGLKNDKSIKDRMFIPAELPVLPLRGTVAYPDLVMPLIVGREKSIRLVDEAMSKDKKMKLTLPVEEYVGRGNLACQGCGANLALRYTLKALGPKTRMVFTETPSNPNMRIDLRAKGLPDAVIEDALGLFGPGERPLAYVLGWMTHLVGDGLIKSIRPGAVNAEVVIDLRKTLLPFGSSIKNSSCAFFAGTWSSAPSASARRCMICPGW